MVLCSDFKSIVAPSDGYQLSFCNFFPTLLVNGLNQSQHNVCRHCYIRRHGFSVFHADVTALSTVLLVEALIEVLQNLNSSTFRCIVAELVDLSDSCFLSRLALCCNAFGITNLVYETLHVR